MKRMDAVSKGEGKGEGGGHKSFGRFQRILIFFTRTLIDVIREEKSVFCSIYGGSFCHLPLVATVEALQTGPLRMLFQNTDETGAHGCAKRGAELTRCSQLRWGVVQHRVAHPKPHLIDPIDMPARCMLARSVCILMEVLAMQQSDETKIEYTGRGGNACKRSASPCCSPDTPFSHAAIEKRPPNRAGSTGARWVLTGCSTPERR